MGIIDSKFLQITQNSSKNSNKVDLTHRLCTSTQKNLEKIHC